MKLLDGKALSSTIKDELKVEVDRLIADKKRPPHLVAVLVGADPASQFYVKSKVKACHRVGYRSSELFYDSDITEHFLLKKLESLNADPEVDGILVQMPLPDHISPSKVIETIIPEKDVDGFHPINIGRMAKGLPALLPATPSGVLEILARYQIETKGKHCVVVGRSNIVGSPMSILMAREGYPGDCTVTLTHIETIDLAYHTRQADILIVAVGKVNLITADMVKDGVVVIDVGINRVPDQSKKRGYRIVGDVDFENVSKKAEYITPVPGGVGPMTIAMLLKNTLEAYKRRTGA